MSTSSAPPLIALVVFAAAALVFAEPAVAQTADAAPRGGWLPHPDRLDTIADRVAAFSAAELATASATGAGGAQRCGIDGDAFTCHCVQLSYKGGRIRARRWQRHGQKVRADHVRVDLAEADSQLSLIADQWVSAEGSHQIESVTLDGQDRRPRVMRAAAMSRAADAGQWGVEELVWHQDLESVPRAECGWEGFEAASEPVYTASSASHAAGRWRVEGFGLGELPIWLTDFEAERPGPVGGALAPTMVYSDGVFDARASYLVEAVGLAPQAVVAPGHWYGVGVGVLGDEHHEPGAPPAVGAGQPGMFNAQLRWSQEPSAVRVAAIGDGLWGAPHTHVSASAEAFQDPAFWTTARLERDGFFRPWRLSRVGASASGPGHVLAVSALYSEPVPGGGEDVGAETVGARARFATSHRLVERIAVDLEANQTSFFASQQDSHATTLKVGASGIIGERQRIFVRPALRGWLEGGWGTQPDGIGASTSAQLVGSAEAGAAFQGRFGGVVHGIEPGVVTMREVAGISRQPEVGRPFGPVGAGRTPRWTLAGARLNQSLRWGDTSVEWPSALLYEGQGLEGAFEHRPWLLSGLVGRRPSFEVQARVGCAHLCDEVLWATGALVRIVSFDVIYMGGRLAAPLAGPLQWQSNVRDGWAFIDAFQRPPSRPAADGLEPLSPQASHLGGLRWRAGRIGVDAGARLQPKDSSAGFTLGNTYAFEEFGWSVGVRAALRTPDGAWGVLVGLTHPG